MAITRPPPAGPRSTNEKYKAQPRDSNPNLTNPVAAIQLNTEKWWSTFPIDRPAPNIRNTPLSINDTCYIQLELPKEGRVTRELLWQDLATIIGHEEQFIQKVQHQQWPTSELLQHQKPATQRNLVGSIHPPPNG